MHGGGADPAGTPSSSVCKATASTMEPEPARSAFPRTDCAQRLPRMPSRRAAPSVRRRGAGPAGPPSSDALL